MKTEIQTQSPLDAARATLVAVQQTAQTAKWNAQGLEGDLRRLRNEYLPTNVTSTRQAELRERLQVAAQYARDTAQYVRAIQGAIEARERLLGHYQHAIRQAEDTKSGAERELQKANAALEKAQQAQSNCENACKRAEQALTQAQGTYNQALDEPITLPAPLAALEDTQARV